ncbi:MAG: hypothetical protein ACN4G0_07205 [Polyangiales bacterium]
MKNDAASESGAPRGFVPQSGKTAFWRLWDALPRNEAGMASCSGLDANERQKLVALYEDENTALGRFLDRYLSHWNS